MTGKAPSFDQTFVETLIRTAFSGVTLGDGISLRQAQAIDQNLEASDADFDALTRDEVTDSWPDVAFEELDRDCVAHLDDAGLRFYLPALMLSILSDYEPSSLRVAGTLSAICNPLATVERMYLFLNDEQHRAVACFLTSLRHLISLDSRDLAQVSLAVHNYWSRYAISRAVVI